MNKFCPFMSKDPSVLDKPKTERHTVYCAKECALYLNGFCSINVLAQKAIHDGKIEKKEQSVSE